MGRSLKKGPYIDFRLKKKIDVVNEKGGKSVIKTYTTLHINRAFLCLLFNKWYI